MIDIAILLEEPKLRPISEYGGENEPIKPKDEMDKQHGKLVKEFKWE